MTGIRVLRTIEHTFETPEHAEQIMSGWTHSLNLPGERMRSVVFPFETAIWEDEGDATDG